MKAITWLGGLLGGIMGLLTPLLQMIVKEHLYIGASYGGRYWTRTNDLTLSPWRSSQLSQSPILDYLYITTELKFFNHNNSFLNSSPDLGIGRQRVYQIR